MHALLATFERLAMTNTMRSRAENITSEEDLKTFVECYERVYGKSILTLDFVKECEDVYLLRDQEGTPVGGYTINTKQAYRTLDFVPAELAAHFREQASGVQTYELGTIWVAENRRNGREKLELSLHILGNMISRKDAVMVGCTGSEDNYKLYSRYGVKLAYYGPMKPPGGDYVQGWIFYIDDLSTTKIQEMHEALKKRLG